VEITQTSQSVTSLTAAASRSGAGGTEFNLFLRLLTTQLQNQDPLDPLKSNEYTQQLAQYSQLEQTIQGNDTLKAILTRLSSQDSAQALGLAGREVVLAGADAGLGTGPATWRYAADRNLASLSGTISDTNGRVVQTLVLPSGSASGSHAWDGTLTNGNRAASGRYTLALRGVDAAGAVVPVAVNATGRVGDVTIDKGVVGIDINGTVQPLAQVVRVVAPGR
jgi:flagellar basal-body rod modification protein FlgD